MGKVGKCHFFLIGCFLWGFLLIVPVRILHAQSDSSVAKITIETRDAAQEGGTQSEEFKKWRESIPDYEKRLYDRVKGINKRIVRILNVVIAGFVVLLILNLVLIYLVLSNRRKNN